MSIHPGVSEIMHLIVLFRFSPIVRAMHYHNSFIPRINSGRIHYQLQSIISIRNGSDCRQRSSLNKLGKCWSIQLFQWDEFSIHCSLINGSVSLSGTCCRIASRSNGSDLEIRSWKWRWSASSLVDLSEEFPRTTNSCSFLNNRLCWKWRWWGWRWKWSWRREFNRWIYFSIELVALPKTKPIFTPSPQSQWQPRWIIISCWFLLIIGTTLTTDVYHIELDQSASLMPSKEDCFALEEHLRCAVFSPRIGMNNR